MGRKHTIGETSLADGDGCGGVVESGEAEIVGVADGGPTAASSSFEDGPG